MSKAVVRRAEEAAEEDRRRALSAERELYWRGIPDYIALDANLQYLAWLHGRRPSSPNDDIFAAIAEVRPVPDLNWQIGEHMFQPDITDEQLHQKCVDYCARSARSFVANAAWVAATIVNPPEEAGPPSRILTGVESTEAGYYLAAEPGNETISTEQAFETLIGERYGGEASTVFKRCGYNGVYPGGQPLELDYARLGVAVDETGVSETKIMAGVGLTIALWVRLVDEQRELEPESPDPKYFGARFWGLVHQTGWSDYAGYTATDPVSYFRYYDEDKKGFLDQFRSPQFFEDTPVAQD